jgi:Leucine-rich repeat (LRR) protein
MNKLLKLFVLLVCVFFVRSAVAMPLESDQRIEIGTDSYSIHQGKDLESAKCYVLKPEGFSKLKDFLLSHKGITSLILFVHTKERQFPEDFFEDLEHLTLLVIIYSGLTSLPRSIGCLINLQELYLGNNCLISLPDTIGELINLTVLYLGTNKLISLPDTIGNLRSLKELKLSFNKITKLPQSIVSLSKSLTLLDIFATRIQRVPDQLLYKEEQHKLRIVRF